MKDDLFKETEKKQGIDSDLKNVIQIILNLPKKPQMT